MKIKSIETFSTQQIGVVRVRTDDGAEGIGQMSAYASNISAQVMHQLVAPQVLGMNAWDIDGVVDHCMIANHKFPGTFMCRAVSGLDTALWDLKGKLESKSVCELLGGTRGEVQVYGSSMSRQITPENEAERIKSRIEKEGFKAFKIKIGKPFGNNEDQWPGRTEELVPTVRKAIGDHTVLLADANSCYTPDKAIEVGRMLEQYGVAHFEEPCPYPEIEWTAQVTKALDIPVSGGEQDNSMAQWKRMIDMKAVNIVQPNVCYTGGVSRALRVAKMAEEAGLICTPHCANHTMSVVFTAHLMRSLSNAGDFMEYSIEDRSWTNDLFYPLLEVRDGKIEVPEGPGWGITVNEEWLKKAHYQISEH